MAAISFRHVLRLRAVLLAPVLTPYQSAEGRLWPIPSTSNHMRKGDALRCTTLTFQRTY